MEFKIYQVEKRFDVDPGDVHIDAAISNIVLDYRPHGFIADQIAPIVPVVKQSDRFFKIAQADRFRTTPDYRAPGTEPNIISFDVSSDGYYCDNYALGTYLTREELANADAALDNRKLRSQLVTDILMLNNEVRVANLVTSTSNVGCNTNTASAWGTSNADPYVDCQADMQAVEDGKGYKPNLVVFGKTSWRKWRESEKIQTLIFPHGGGIPTVEHAKLLLEVDKVLIGGAYYNSAAQGATMSLSKVWDDMVFYAYVAPKPSKEVPSFMYSFRWTVPGVPSMIARVFPFDEKQGRQDIHVAYYQDEKITDKGLGYLRLGVGSSQ
jgi:hypothetical protein